MLYSKRNTIMASHVFLNRERNFLELNKELEEKVKSLMVEVDSIISKQEDVMRSPKHSFHFTRRSKMKLNEPQPVTETNDEENMGNENSAFEKCVKIRNTNERIIDDLYEHIDDEEDDDIKTKKKRSTNETIIRFLKAQVTKFQADMQAVQYEIKKKTEQCKEFEAEIKSHEDKREKLQNQISYHKDAIVKAETSNSELNLKIQAQNTEIASLKKEIEGLKKDVKYLSQLSSNSDLRLNRSLEENEKLKSSLKISQTEERELREQIRKIQEEKRLALKNSEKQRAEIFQAFKKQTQLVDNLKKQKAYLEASKEIQFIEEDFTRLLEWKPDKS